MRVFGPSTLFAQNALVHLGLALFTLWRILIKDAPTGSAQRSPGGQLQGPRDELLHRISAVTARRAEQEPGAEYGEHPIVETAPGKANA